jgi:hypothetical protein
MNERVSLHLLVAFLSIPTRIIFSYWQILTFFCFCLCNQWENSIHVIELVVVFHDFSKDRISIWTILFFSFRFHDSSWRHLNDTLYYIFFIFVEIVYIYNNWFYSFRCSFYFFFLRRLIRRRRRMFAFSFSVDERMCMYIRIRSLKYMMYVSVHRNKVPIFFSFYSQTRIIF